MYSTCIALARLDKLKEEGVVVECSGYSLILDNIADKL